MTTQYEQFLAALVSPVQVLEDTLQAVKIGRLLDYAVGVQLDAIGKIVGRPRNGLTDDDNYRRVIRAQIAANKSDGLIEDFITVTDLVVYEDDGVYVVTNWGGATITIRVDGVAITWTVAELLNELLQKAKSGGVRLYLEFSELDPDDAFQFADDTTETLDAADGWGDTLDAAAGGPLMSVLS